MLASREEIKRVIKDIRNRRNKWVLSRRPKNMATLANLAIQETLALDIIYNKTSWQDYISGQKQITTQDPFQEISGCSD